MERPPPVNGLYAFAARTLSMTGASLADDSVAVSGQLAPVRSQSDGSWAYHFPPVRQATAMSVTASLADR